jgi:hypothetical protein
MTKATRGSLLLCILLSATLSWPLGVLAQEGTAGPPTTSSPQGASAVRIEQLHVIFSLASGRAVVTEIYIFSNDGDRTYVGTPDQGTVRLTVPADALSFQVGGDPDRYLSLSWADGVVDTVPVPPGPGTAESTLAYEMAYDGNLELSRPMPHDVNQVLVLVPDVGVEVDGDGIQPGGPFQMGDATFQAYLAGDLSAGDHLRLRLSGEPQTGSAPVSPAPRRSSGPNETQSTIIGALALVGALALSYLYWQGHLNLRLKPSASERQLALLQAIAAWDDDFEAGRVPEKSYRAERARLKGELMELVVRDGVDGFRIPASRP